MKGVTIEQLEAFIDPRGWVTHPLDEEKLAAGAFGNIHLVSMEPGSIRGNHMHREQTEYVQIIGGPCLFAALDPDSGENMEREFDEDDLFTIRVEPGIAHAFMNVSDRSVFLFCAGDTRFDPNKPDSESVIVID